MWVSSPSAMEAYPTGETLDQWTTGQPDGAGLVGLGEKPGHAMVKSKTNWVQIDALGDQDIDYSEVPELGDDFFENALLKLPAHINCRTIE